MESIHRTTLRCIAVVQDFDPICVGAATCANAWLLQIKHRSTDTLAQQIVSEYLSRLQSNQ